MIDIDKVAKQKAEFDALDELTRIWTPERWFTAIVGELGEASNAMKKLWRIEDDLPNISKPGREIKTSEAAIEKIGHEMADAVHYIVLWAERYGIDLERNLIKTFDRKSEEYGFPERLGEATSGDVAD